jgi:hypothetical protein
MSLAGSQNFFDIANWRSGYMTSRIKHMQPGEKAAWTILYGEHGCKNRSKEDVIENEQRAVQATKVSRKIESHLLPLIEDRKHKTDNIENPQVDEEFFKTSIEWLKLNKPNHETYIDDVTDPPVQIPDLPSCTVRGLLLKAIMNQTPVFKYFTQFMEEELVPKLMPPNKETKEGDDLTITTTSTTIPLDTITEPTHGKRIHKLDNDPNLFDDVLTFYRDAKPGQTLISNDDKPGIVMSPQVKLDMEMAIYYRNQNQRPHEEDRQNPFLPTAIEKATNERNLNADQR